MIEKIKEKLLQEIREHLKLKLDFTEYDNKLKVSIVYDNKEICSDYVELPSSH